ncbi:MAG TPA: EAL domain-containing protein [Gammaproteobacteria bacterium]|nr:EAL domain-containing protein [Gammaproteobacteria bacterium]
MAAHLQSSPDRIGVGGDDRYRRIQELFRSGPGDARVLTYRGVQVGSAYQPIYELGGGTLAGHEALLRCSNEEIDPHSLFQVSDYYYETLDVDDAVRILHLENYAALAPAGNGRIFVKTHPQTLSNPVKAETLSYCIESLGLSWEGVALELAEDQVEDLDAVSRAVEPFRARGCAIVANGYDVGCSNLERVWMLRPDFVKFERSMLPTHLQVPDPAALLGGLAATFRGAGIRTVMKGVETWADLEATLEAGIEYAQGYYLQPPIRDAVPDAGAEHLPVALERFRRRA